MLEIDRDLYLAFAKVMGLDFGWAGRLIDGQIQADPLLANTLGHFAGTSPEIWIRENMGPVRLTAVKVWAVKERQAGRLTRPALEVAHQAPPPRHCRVCD